MCSGKGYFCRVNNGPATQQMIGNTKITGQNATMATYEARRWRAEASACMPPVAIDVIVPMARYSIISPYMITPRFWSYSF